MMSHLLARAASEEGSSAQVIFPRLVSGPGRKMHEVCGSLPAPLEVGRWYKGLQRLLSAWVMAL